MYSAKIGDGRPKDRAIQVIMYNLYHFVILFPLYYFLNIPLSYANIFLLDTLEIVSSLEF